MADQHEEDVTVNEELDMLQPTEAAFGQFPEGTDIAAITESLIAADVDASSVHVLVGEEGMTAYKDRASSFARLFDDTDERVVDALFAGEVIVFVFDVPEERGDAIRTILKDAGATDTVYFGKYTHEG